MKIFSTHNEDPSEYEKLKFTRPYQSSAGLMATERSLRPFEIRGIVAELRNNRVDSCLAPVTLGVVCQN